ncbi:MAG: VWA domain-containing protein [Thermoplasmata archaeon]|nr:VWA domain-containing protein [Thermoplasmata archaeon]
MSTRPLPGDHLHRRLVEFIVFLRERGVPVGIGAEVELGRALEILPGLSRADYRHASETILAKSPAEVAEVRRAFELFFSPGETQRGIPTPGRSTVAGPIRMSTEKRRPDPTPVETDSEPPAGVTSFGVYSPQAPAAGHVLSPVGSRERLSLRRGARRFRRRAATLPGRRFARARRGPVDFPETLRRSLAKGGEWIELSRHGLRNRRAELVILWDVSGSMREHDALLFALVYALVRLSRSARVFAFSTRIEEITEEIRRHGYERATTAVASRIVGAGGGTQIGSCLHQFLEMYPSTIGDRTTVVVISDGWDRAESTVLGEELHRIRRRSHLVVWVSPYARRPGFEPKTAGLVAALPHTDLLLGPEDFRSPYPLPPIDRGVPGTPVPA